MGSGPVDGILNIGEGWLEHGVASVKADIDFEEGLEHLLGGVASTADSLLHLV